MKKNKKLLCIFIFLFFNFNLLWAESLSHQAELAWQNRSQPGQTEKAIQQWQEVLRQTPENPKLYIVLSKACGRAYRHANTKKERLLWADQARDYGEKAVQKNPTDAEAYTRLGEALGQWAQAHAGVSSFSAVRQSVQTLQKAVALDPHHGFAHMLLAEIYRQAPRWPLSVGNKRKALEHARLAVQYGGYYAITRLALARIDLDLGNKTEAREQLEEILRLTPQPDVIPETLTDQGTAREMLKHLGKMRE